jgi:short subunit dehydrogenase-like uncharacterized protein
VPGRIVVFGATGYTGRLVARSLVRSGGRPTLAGRYRDRLDRLAADLGGLPVAVADSGRPATVRALVAAGDVLISTVGPFMVHGRAAVDAAVDAGATYLDCAGEPPFVREVFERDGPRAAGRAALLPAFGYDFVPGNLAGALALRDAGPAAVRVDVGYFALAERSAGGGPSASAASSGTLASVAGVALSPSFAFRDGRLVRERAARHVRTFEVGGRPRQAVSYSGTEHLALPRLAPGLREVGVYLGWFGGASGAVRRLSVVGAAAGAALGALPGGAALARAASAPLRRRTGAGPDEAARARLRSHVVAIAYGPDGSALAEARLTGPNPYEITADLIAWGAHTAAGGGIAGTGALGPVEAIGLDALVAGAAGAGIARLEAPAG